ncbi:hypothetical protein Leryth_011120 [Lithospermum erythrorhizon]|nr:hypothetical protein Leryth_011120 [Lithospermum erythrorhizon]
MITIKAIQTSLIIQNNSNKHAKLNKNNNLRRRASIICLSKSNDESDSETPASQGDTKKQELLAKIAQLQTQKVRLTDFLDERSDYLTQFAEEANAEIDMIGENALRELDEAGARIMGNIEGKMQAFEESMEMNKTDIEESEKKLADFEEQIEDDRNEGLFFKNLGRKTPVDEEKAKEETQKIKEITKRSADSTIRRNIYLALIALVVIGILDAVISSSSSPDLRKVAILGAVFIGLISQVTYEQIIQKNEDEKP